MAMSIFTSASPSSDACDTPPWTAAGEWFAGDAANLLI
ncbi:hypothetical protein AD00_5608 [Escherichia coli 2-316-03_S4_C2]|nr:hypothetical protein AD00_5608 [Escherichia coli 2-316-03_S4_C2]